MAVTQQSYVDSNSKVKAARKKLAEAKSKLDSLSKAQVPSGAGSKVAADVASRIDQAKKDVESANTDVQEIETKARNYFDKHSETIQSKAESKAAAKKESNAATSQAQIEAMRRAGIDVTEAERLISKVNKPKAVATGGDSGSGTGGGDNTSAIEQANKKIDSYIDKSQQFVFDLNEPGARSNLAKELTKANFYEGPITDTYTPDLAIAYKAFLTGAKNYNNQNKSLTGFKPVDIDSFLAYRKDINKGSGSGGPTSGFEKSIDISAPTEARALIQQQFQDILGREATPEELSLFRNKLNEAEKKNAKIAKSTTSKSGKSSSSSVVYSGGINKSEFLAEQIKKLPEYAKKKSESASLTAQSIQSTINANGLNLPAEQIDAWTKAVQNGTKLDVILNQVRQIAASGMPDNVKKMLAEGTDLSTIYSPYKQTMAATLELDPNAINLNDPILRSAIGANGEMPIYDFQRALRKDARWQYTNNAREEVSNSVSKVLQDFGFMG